MENKLGKIQSKNDTVVELSTRCAVRLFRGRAKNEKRWGIMGITGFSKLLGMLEYAIVNDDPYADQQYIRIEKAIEELKIILDKQLEEQIELIDKRVPKAMKIADAINASPLPIPIRFSSSLAFKMLYQILTVDLIVLKVLQADHVGLIDSNEKFSTISSLEKQVRAVYHLSFGYKFTGVTRVDMLADNEKAKIAIEAMGKLDDDILSYSNRSINAPKPKAERSNIKRAKQVIESDEEKQAIA